MALYDGFFDAQLVEVNDNGVIKTEFDRDYNHTAFTDYFEKIIGSGVCVSTNPDSFRVRMEGGSAVVSPGYLFIQGYWLKNDADYSIPVSGSSTLAIAAHLNMGKRMIELEAVSMAQSYPDSLVLSLVNPEAGSAEDTRRNTDICGVIESAGELSTKVEWALNYINNEIEGRLDAAHAEIDAQSAALDAKIAQVQAQVAKITPPPVGTIQYSAAQNVGEEWLPCDGRFVSDADYPELVAALGKLTPSGDKFKLISDGEIGPQITNSVLYNGKLWIYSHRDKKLYGVDLSGGNVTAVPVSSSDTYFKNFITPTPQKPIVLSIVPHINGSGSRLFLAQCISDTGIEYTTTSMENPTAEFHACLLLFSAEFSGTETSLTLERPVKKIAMETYTSSGSVKLSYNIHPMPDRYAPYVISNAVSGTETYYCMWSDVLQVSNYSEQAGGTLVWTAGNDTAQLKVLHMLAIEQDQKYHYQLQRIGFSPKNRNEAVSVDCATGTVYAVTLYSQINGTHEGSFRDATINLYSGTRTTRLPLCAAGDSGVVLDIMPGGFVFFDRSTVTVDMVGHGIPLPSAARVFYDGAGYLFGKDIYMIFLGTGLLFFRKFNRGDVGYLDTTGVMGTITQYGYMEYSQDENTLFLVGQDTANKVKVAKMELNTLYDYANNGAWLPTLAADGVPAYIKAKEMTS